MTRNLSLKCPYVWIAQIYFHLNYRCKSTVAFYFSKNQGLPLCVLNFVWFTGVWILKGCFSLSVQWSPYRDACTSGVVQGNPLAYRKNLFLFQPFKKLCMYTVIHRGFPGGSDGKESACSAGGPGLIPGLGRSPGEGNDNPLQYSCLENSMDRERSLAGYSPWSHKELDMTEWLTHTCRHT